MFETINSKSSAMDIYLAGHRLRWLKQMALRGKGRRYDDHGVCGKMRLVISCELEFFMANVSRLFPGAKVRITSAGERATWGEKIITILNEATTPQITTSELGDLLGKPWAKIRYAVLTQDFLRTLEAMGWRYAAPGKGRPGGRFERVEPIEALAA